MKRTALVLLITVAFAQAQTPGELAAGYLRDLIRLDSSNPPGNETRVANYLKRIADREGIPAELVGDDPQRLNFIGRLRGSGKQRPLLLMAHSDVVPVDRTQWTVDPFAAVEKNGYLYGRGAEDDKNLLAAEGNARSRPDSFERSGRGIRLERREMGDRACVFEDRRRIRAQ
jgi:hypothetical protein